MPFTRRDILAMAAVLPGARRGDPHVYDFRGTSFEVGRQHGKSLSREIRAETQPAADALARQLGLAVEAAAGRFRSRHEGIFREHMPAVLEEVHGIAEGAQLSYDFAFFAATRDMTRTGACTAIAAGGGKTREGRILIGQTKDTTAPLERFRIMRIAYASGRRMVILNYPGWIGNMCLTSDGLSFTGNSLYGARPTVATAPGSFLKRLVIEKKSTAEVLEAIRGMRFENGCLLIADAAGHAVCIEFVAGQTDVRDISGEAFGHANEVLAVGLKRHETAEHHSASSPFRQKNVDRLLGARAGSLTADSFAGIFRDHTDFPLSICRHPAATDPETTNAAFVADLTAREMHIAIGNPCVAPFIRYVLPV
jgi:isopenicillin-N N-acyltransferase-like protein